MIRRHLLAACLGMWLAGTVSIGWGAAGDEEFLDQVRNTWDAREASVPSFVVEWVEQQTIRKGGDGPGPDGKPLPPKATTRPASYRMACDGRRVRLTQQGIQFDINFNKYMEKTFISVFDGTDRRQVYDSEKTREHPSGFLNRRAFFDDGGDLRFVPPLQALRPGVPELNGIDFAIWRLLGERRSSDGIACRILDRPRPDGGTELIWIEEAGDHRILRRQAVAGEQVFEDLSLQYPPSSHIPVSWRLVTRRRNGSINDIYAVVDPEFHLNAAVSEQEFDSPFVPGATITIENETGRAVVRDDGSLRLVTEGEIAAGIPAEVLMTTSPPPEARALMPGRSWNWTLIMIAFVAVGGVVWWRRSRALESE